MNTTKINLNIKTAILFGLMLLLAQIVFSLVILVPRYFLGYGITNKYLFQCAVFFVSFLATVNIISSLKNIELPYLLRFDKAKDIYFILAVSSAVALYFLETRCIVPLVLYVAPRNNSLYWSFLTRGDNSYSYLLLAVIIAPFTEELFFRGIILRGMLANIKETKAIIISAVLFSIYHYNPYLFLPTFVIGLPLGYLYARSGSVVPCIVMHAVYNLFFRLEVYH